MAEAGEVVPLRRLQRSWYTNRVRSETSAPGQRILRGHGRVQKGRGWPCGGAHNRSHDCPSPPFPRPSRRLLPPAARRTGGKERRPWAVLEAAAPPPTAVFSHLCGRSRFHRISSGRLRLGRGVGGWEGARECTFCTSSSLTRVLIIALLNTF